MAAKVVYFTVDGKDEQAEFTTDDSSDEIREIFRAAAEAGPNDILKLYNVKGSLLNISSRLSENTPTNRYKLHVVAAYCDGTPVTNQIGLDIGAIESRLESMECRVFAEEGNMPHVVQDMKTKVEGFKQKLENVEHLSWLGLFKDISSGTSLQPFWNKMKSIRKSQEENNRTYDKFMKMSRIQVTDEVSEYLRKPTFDNWQWDDSEMLILLRQMFIDLDFINKFNIELTVLQQWLYELYKNYNQVPFHNFKHCFMVAQMIYGLNFKQFKFVRTITREQFNRSTSNLESALTLMYGLTWVIDLPGYMEDIDLLILIVSAICHDLDHPGYNNAYQINARTELALRYNDISPLENHHCAVAFEILAKHDCNIFRNVSHDQYKRIREGMIRCILATDMAKHSEILSSFRACIPAFEFSNKEHKAVLTMILMKVSDISNEARPMDVAEPWLDCLLQEFFNQLLMILIKVADISNEARPMEVAEPWLECLLEEFFRQSDMEKLEGLPVAPFMDREKVTKSSSQIGFIKFVLLPLFETLGQLFPIVEDHIIQPVRFALDYYTDMQKALDDDKKRKDSTGRQNGLKTDKPNGKIKS